MVDSFCVIKICTCQCLLDRSVGNNFVTISSSLPLVLHKGCENLGILRSQTRSYKYYFFYAQFYSVYSLRNRTYNCPLEIAVNDPGGQKQAIL